VKVIEAAAAAVIPKTDFGYVPTPRQAQFHANYARYRLFGGAAGPGKSLATVMEHTSWCLRRPGWQALILRRLSSELEQSLIQRFLAKIDPELYTFTRDGSGGIATFHPTKALSPNNQASRLRFAHCQHEDDVFRFKSDQFDSIGFDELTEFTLFIWTYMSTRNRLTAEHQQPCQAFMTGATNPEGVGLEWVKSLWIDKEPAAEMDEAQAQGYVAERDEYAFIPALLSDNPHMERIDPGYRDRLAKLPAHLRGALLEGRWDVVPSSYYGEVWSRERHVVEAMEVDDRRIRAVELLGLKDWNPRWISIDYGWTHHYAVYWHAMIGNKPLTYREMTGTKTTPALLAERIGIISKKANETEAIKRLFIGPDSFAERHAEHTIAGELGKALRPYGLPQPERAANDRAGGALLIFQLLQADALLITDECPKLIKSIPLRQVDPDPKKERDVLKTNQGELEDCFESWRYGIYSMLRGVKKTFEERVEERITATEPVVAFGQMMKAMHEIRQKNRPVRQRPNSEWGG